MIWCELGGKNQSNTVKELCCTVTGSGLGNFVAGVMILFSFFLFF